MVDRVDLLASVSGILKTEEPIKRTPHETAAVAVILRGRASGLDVLLIKRAERNGDPWSGQVALPGGRVAPRDGSFMETAERESQEEVALDLERASFSGYLGAFQSRTGGISVVAAVFVMDEDQEVRLNQEVSSYRWVPLAELLAPEKRRSYTLEWGGKRRSVPSFDLDDYLVWGLTERILSRLVEAVERRPESSSG